MTTFLLVHGGTAGGWCWKRVVPLLRAQGHEVFYPTLTGLGERCHLASPEVGLETHIQDVMGVLEYEDLSEVVLVGHSLGGTVVTGVADRASQRIAHLVYLDAVVPKDGQSSLDCMSPEFRAFLDEQVQTLGDGWRLMPMSFEDSVTDEADLKWANSKATPHPYRCFQDVVRYNPATLAALPRTYINCIGDQPPGGERPKSAAGMNYLEIASKHVVMIAAPHELADMLLAFA